MECVTHGHGECLSLRLLLSIQTVSVIDDVDETILEALRLDYRPRQPWFRRAHSKRTPVQPSGHKSGCLTIRVSRPSLCIQRSQGCQLPQIQSWPEHEVVRRSICFACGFLHCQHDKTRPVTPPVATPLQVILCRMSILLEDIQVSCTDYRGGFDASLYVGTVAAPRRQHGRLWRHTESCARISKPKDATPSLLDWRLVAVTFSGEIGRVL